MTTPHQEAPDGAFVIGDGGGEFRYGQEYSESGVSELLSIPRPGNPTEAVGVLKQMLRMAPKGTLDGLQNVFPELSEDDFQTSENAADTVVNSLEEKPDIFDVDSRATAAVQDAASAQAAADAAQNTADAASSYATAAQQAADAAQAAADAAQAVADSTVDDVTTARDEAADAQAAADAAQAKADAAQAQADAAAAAASSAQSAADDAQATADAKVDDSQFEAYISAGDNLATNPSFDDTKQYLPSGGWASYSTEQSQTATRSLKVVSDGTTHRYVPLSTNRIGSVKVRARGGRTYYIEGWIYGKSTNTGTGTGDDIGIGVWGYNWLNGYENSAILYASPNEVGTGAWVKISGFVTMPNNNAIVRALPHAFTRGTNPSGDTYYFEDVIVQDVTEAIQAQETADAANVAAGQAQTTADNASSAASAAQAAADAAQSLADTAQAKADTAQAAADAAQLTANNTVDDLSTVQDEAALAQQAADAAQAQADAAQAAADAAQAAADSAQTTANSASTAASGAQSTADGAATAASTAQSAADAAQASADAAAQTAADAQSAANAAQATANTADAAAATAQAAADAAQSKADAAQATADATVDDLTTVQDEAALAQAAADAAQAQADAAQAAADSAASAASTAHTVADNAQSAADSAASAASAAQSAADGAQSTADSAASAASAAQGTADTANTNLGTLTDHVTNAFTGDGGFVGSLLENAREAMDKLYSDLSQNTRSIQELQAHEAGREANGKVINIDFADYPDGPIPSSLFTVSYSGSGASTLGIKDGVAQWVTKVNDAPRSAKLISVEPTETDFQALRGTMASPPMDETASGKPYFYALARVSDDGNTYVWARAWSVGSFFLYRGDIGITINGVETVWQSDIPLTWSMDMSFLAGVGNDPHQYQVWSGNKLVVTYDDTTESCPLGASNRRWGSIAQVVNGGAHNKANDSGKVAGCSIADNELPAVKGTTAAYYRTSSSSETYYGGDSLTALPTNFFEFVSRASRDIGTNTADAEFTIETEGNYSINARILLAKSLNAMCHVVLTVNDAVVQWGDSVYPTHASGMALTGHWEEYLYEGDVVSLKVIRPGITVNNVLTGEATGTQTFFDITKVG